MHVIFRAQPRTELSKFINAYKSASSRLLKKEYPEIRKKHREPAEGLRLRSVTVSMEPSGKYFASLLYEGYSCENQAAEPDYSTAKILGIDYAMQGMAVFSEKIEMEEAGFFPSSKKCCKCGRIKKELRLSERVYHCECGNEMDRDRNAAINIREEAKRMLTA